MSAVPSDSNSLSNIMPAGNGFVVGIGISADDLQAFQQFIKNLPNHPKAAIVIVQPSAIAQNFDDIKQGLEQSTSLPILEVKEPITLEINRIYLLAINQNFCLHNRHLQVRETTPDLPEQSSQFPIDLFFQSLAEDCGEWAMGITFLGAGSDGKKGLKAIKEAGGFTFAQEPETGKFTTILSHDLTSTPDDQRLNLDTLAQIVDQIINPQLYSLTAQPISSSSTQVLEDFQVRHILEILAQDTDTDFSPYKRTTLSRRIQRRCLIADYSNIQNYIAYLESSPTEREILRKELLITVTSFFRDPEAWEFLETQVIPKLIEQIPPQGQLRCWVSACATGEEAYSLAILLHEALERLNYPIYATIFATDIDTGTLEKASRGIYPLSIISELSTQRLQRYFIQQEQGYEVSKILRDMIIFAPHNLIRDVGFTRINLVSCRNVLIYLQPLFQQHVLRTLHFSLVPQGKLFLGKSESISSLENEFLTLHKTWKIYEKHRNVRLPLPLRISQDALPRPPQKIALKDGERPQFDPILEAAFKALLIDRQITCLLVNRENKLLYLIEDLANILEIPRGQATQDITKMVMPALQLPLTTALHRVRQDKQPVLYEGLQFTKAGQTFSYKLKVSYLGTPPLSEDLLMVTVEREDQPETIARESFEFNREATQRILELEYELQQTQESLQSTIEELESTTEEQQATNEELIAANEELQSTNEELYSVNSELYTINAQYQTKINELTQLTNDIENLLRSTNIGVIFLDRSLNIRKFTPAATLAINLLETDIGRPIHHLSHNLEDIHLSTLLKEVLERQQAREYEVKLKQTELYFLMRIYPYQLDNQPNTDGLVLTFVEINQLKKFQKELQITNANLQQEMAERQQLQTRFQSTFEQAAVGLAHVDLSGRWLKVNEKLCQIVGYTREELLERTFQDITHPDDLEADLLYVQQLLSGEIPNYSMEKRYIHKDGNIIWILLTGSLVRTATGAPDYCIAVVQDISDRKQMQEAIQASRSQLQGIINNSTTVIYVKDIQGRYLLINHEYERLVNVTNEFVQGKTDFEIFPQEIAESFWNHDYQVIQEKTAINFEESITLADGVHQYLAVKFPLKNANGDIYAVCGISTDITERKQTEEALRRSLALNQAITTALPELIIRVSRDGNYLDFSVPENFPLIAPETERVGVNIREALPTDVAQQRLQYIEETLSTQQTQIVEFKREIDGKTYWQEDCFVPSGDNEVIIVVRDITHRKQIELALKESEERYALVVQGSGEGIWEVNMTTNQAYASPRYKEILGYEESETVFERFQDWENALHPDDLNRVREAVAVHFSQRGSFQQEFRLRKKNGDYCWVLSVAQGIWDEAGNPIRMAGSIQDITDRKLAEAELQKLAQQLQQLNQELETRVETRTAQLQTMNDQLSLTNAELARVTRLKDEFLANMSHELRTPLNSILGLSEVLEEGIHGSLNEYQLKSLETITRNGKHLLSLINDILDLAKIESGKIELELAPVSLRILCKSSLAFVKEQALKKRIQLSSQIPNNLPLANLDERRMRQVLINLLSNAVKFTPAQGRVCVEVRCENERDLVLSVTDTGIGIAPENQSKLFQSFVQIDSSLSRSYEGTGLGLALVKKLTELHGGTVSVESEVEQGSCFCIRIPQAFSVSVLSSTFAEPTQTKTQPKIENSVPKKQPLILLAEDNPDNIRVFYDYLTYNNYRVILATNGQEAITIAKAQKPQLIFMDIQMPELDGLEATRQLRADQNFANIPIIALTALVMAGDRERCIQAGATDYLSKPVSLKTLKATLEKWLPKS
jgi:PAS domain S-box-containing protein